MYTSLLHPWSPNPTASETVYRAAGLVRTKGTVFLLPPPSPTLRAAFNTPPRPKTRMSAGAVALCKHFERTSRVGAPSRPPQLVVCGSSDGGSGQGRRDGDDDGGGGGGGDECQISSPRQRQRQRQQKSDVIAAQHVRSAPATPGPTSSSSPPPPPSPPAIQAGRRPEGAAQSYKLVKRKEGDAPHPYWDEPRGSNEEKTKTAEKVMERVLRDAVWRNVMLLHDGVAVYEVRVREGWGMRWRLDVVAATADAKRVRVDDDDDDDDGGDDEETEKGCERKRKQVGERENEETGWRITNVTFRGLLEPIAGLDHELDLDLGLDADLLLDQKGEIIT